MVFTASDCKESKCLKSQNKWVSDTSTKLTQASDSWSPALTTAPRMFSSEVDESKVEHLPRPFSLLCCLLLFPLCSEGWSLFYSHSHSRKFHLFHYFQGHPPLRTPKFIFPDLTAPLISIFQWILDFSQASQTSHLKICPHELSPNLVFSPVFPISV